MKNIVSIIIAVLFFIFASVVTNVNAEVSTTTCTTTSSCNGSATDFTFDFPIISTSDLIVILRTVADGTEEVLTESTDYSVSAVNNDYSSGGTVTTVSTYSSSYSITILRDIDDTQDTDLEDSDVLRLEDLEDALDKLTMLVQQLQEQLNRCIYVPRSDDVTTALDDSVTRASTYLTFDSSGNVTASTTVDEGSVSVSAFMETVLDDADADAAKTTLEVPTISSFAETVLDDVSAAAARTTLGAVGLTGDETIAGAKTFSGAATFSTASTFADSSQMASDAAPTSDADIANKKYVDDASEPYARMYLNAAQNNLTDVTWTTISLDTDSHDSGTITDTSGYKITPAVAGYYLVTGQIAYTNIIAEKTYEAQIYKNGSTAIATAITNTGAATIGVTVSVTDVVYLDDDDYVQLRGYVNAGANTVDIDPGTTDTYLALHRL